MYRGGKLATEEAARPLSGATEDELADDDPDDITLVYFSTPLPKQFPSMQYTPPVNFGLVTHNLYRSSFPQKENFSYLHKLGLKSVLYVPYISENGINNYRTLVQEEYPPENIAFLESVGIKFFQFPIPANKEPFVVIPDTSVIGALETVLDKRNHPILVHCNAGKVFPSEEQR